MESWAYWGMDRVSLSPGTTVKVMVSLLLSSVSFSPVVPLSAVKVKVTGPTFSLVGVIWATVGSSSSGVMVAMLGAELIQVPVLLVVLPGVNFAWSRGKVLSSRAMVYVPSSPGCLPSTTLMATLCTSTWAAMVTVWVTRLTVTHRPPSFTWSWTVTICSVLVGAIA